MKLGIEDLDQRINQLAWTCPYCDRDTIINPPQYTVEQHRFEHKDAHYLLRTRIIICPNMKCREYAILVKPSYLLTSSKHC